MTWRDWIGTVQCMDCLEGMKQMPDGCVDLVVTSPPFNCRKDYGEFKDQMPWPRYYEWIRGVIGECYRVLVLGGVLALNVPGVVRWQASHKYADTWSDFDPDYKTHRNGESVVGKGRIEPIGFTLFDMMCRCDPHIREPIIWVKGTEGNAICSDYRMGCDSDPYMRPAHEFILLGSKGRWFHRGGTGRRGADAVPFLDETKDVWFIPPARFDGHPAVFPDELPSRLIKLFTHVPDALILDIFMGIGTTAYVAKQLGRRFLGFDTNPTYVSICNQRLAQGVFNLKAE